GAFFAAGVALAMFQQPEPVAVAEPVADAAPAAEQPASGVATLRSGKIAEPEESLTPVRDQYSAWVISGHMKLGTRTAYMLADPEGRSVSLDALASMGLDVVTRGNCHVRIFSRE